MVPDDPSNRHREDQIFEPLCFVYDHYQLSPPKKKTIQGKSGITTCVEEHIMRVCILMIWRYTDKNLDEGSMENF